ncbi:chemotaxis protein CheW [Methylotenera sp. N17]|uniref:chemotaxis protein CheW n=1 Tax=Methylotenera sp. N17 TaxID=1502761 RepID=UPI000648F91D|nr:chemotaxis protein CheW [Methylotenera sp. N17]
MELRPAVVSNKSTFNAENASGEYLTFSLGSESYALEILKVQEIRGYDTVTKIVNTPEFVKGVVNLRGKIVPIVDLRVKFGLQQAEYDELTVVIILNLNGRDVGIVVDSVSDVIDLKAEQIRNIPSLVSTIDTKHLVGLATIDEQMLILVDIEKLMSPQEFAFLDATLIN